MKNSGHYVERDISERTKKNFYHAQSILLPFGGRSIFFLNLHTDQTRWMPIIEREENQEWWDLSLCSVKVSITRFYWLRFGLAKVSPELPISTGKDIGL